MNRVVVGPLLRFRRPVIVLGFVLLYGVLGYVLLEGWGFHDALYMTIMTITTVGYREVYPLSRTGEVFTMTLIVGGVATMLWTFGVFAEMLNDEGLNRFQRQRRMERSLGQLRDHFIICGYGRIGTQVVLELVEADVPYVVIDINPVAIERLEHEGRLHLLGDGASEESLRIAGIERARGLVSAVDSDERAVYITLAARAIRSDLFIIARAGHPESIRRLELAGADRVVSPYGIAGHRMAEMALRPALVDVMDTIRQRGIDVGVVELLVRHDMPAIGRTVADAGLMSNTSARLLALRRSDGTLMVNPDAELTMQEGDLLVVLGSREQIDHTSRLLQ